ncbi:hypothetical protein [Streptomyces sp. NPDC020489]|uniref:hypothetical protein n=1 Tax=Streptomyces sp. NPDC020489 TaxID=3365077 RepID=UPI003788EE6F
MRTRAIAAAVLTAGLLLTACTSSDSDEATRTKASPDATNTPTAGAPSTSTASPEDAAKDAEEEFEKSVDDVEKALGETIGVQDGTYEVTKSAPEYDDPSKALDDEYIAPGTYTTKGLADRGPSCYWARMRDASGKTESIIANDLTTGRATVTVSEGEFFKTSDCKPWTRSGS